MLCKFTDVRIPHVQAVVCVRSVHLLTQHSISHSKGLFVIVTAIRTSKFYKKIPDNSDIHINVTQVTDKQNYHD